jgi:hypothetical protein
MALLAPPPAPPSTATTTGDDDRLRKLRMRLFQIAASTITVLATVFFCRFGFIWAILAIMVAKHVLVAILLMGLGVDAPEGMPR